VFNNIETYKQGIRDAFSVEDENGNRLFSDADIDKILEGNMSVLEGK
jgi:hypothetical protein